MYSVLLRGSPIVRRYGAIFESGGHRVIVLFVPEGAPRSVFEDTGEPPLIRDVHRLAWSFDGWPNSA